VLALIKGESLDELSRRHKIPAATISQWHDEFLNAGQAGLKARQPDPRDEQIRKLKEKLGDLMFEYDAVVTVNQAFQAKERNSFR
ncbi:helix-turn-helix domain-containing protein, partial [bacterium]|nr:helix-turn-helix domain-containing protein [bacterium]